MPRSWHDTGRIVLFGIQPTLPETGFGYIECSAIPVGDAPQSVRRFVEKPSPEKATEYLAAGNYLWNSGMFCFTAGTMLEALKRHAPAVLEAARMAVERGSIPTEQPPRLQLDRAMFQSAPDISIDYAVMERESNVAVVAGDFGWSDIGSWNAVGEELERDCRRQRDQRRGRAGRLQQRTRADRGPARGGGRAHGSGDRRHSRRGTGRRPGMLRRR